MHILITVLCETKCATVLLCLCNLNFNISNYVEIVAYKNFRVKKGEFIVSIVMLL
jgi:hypothetical protein